MTLREVQVLGSCDRCMNASIAALHIPVLVMLRLADFIQVQ